MLVALLIVLCLFYYESQPQFRSQLQTPLSTMENVENLDTVHEDLPTPKSPADLVKESSTFTGYLKSLMKQGITDRSFMTIDFYLDNVPETLIK